jgi:Dimerisation domain
MESINSFSLSADLIFQTLIGFWASKALMTAAQLELFTKLSGGKKVTLDGLQKILDIEVRPVGVFASAIASLGLLQVTKEEEESSEFVFANSLYLKYLKRFWISRRILTWAISLPCLTSVFTRHEINLLNLFRQTSL